MIRDASESSLDSIDSILNFEVGSDILVTHTLVGTGSFVDGGVAHTFLVLNDGTADFDAAADTVIEITGYTGDLSQLAAVGVPDLGSFSGIPAEESMVG